MHDNIMCSTYFEPVIPDEKGNCSLCGATLVNANSTYTQQQAIADGVLVEVFKDRWSQLTGGRPILATSHLYQEVTEAFFIEIWNDYVKWNKQIKDTLPEDLQMYVTTMNGRKIWVIEGEQTFTILFAEDY